MYEPEGSSLDCCSGGKQTNGLLREANARYPDCQLGGRSFYASSCHTYMACTSVRSFQMLFQMDLANV
jgi:hypothetical protein